MSIKGAYFIMDQKVPFQKHWVDVATQITVLASRGLIVNDPTVATDFLSHVNYYRFTGYCLRFQLPPDAMGVRKFISGTNFSDVRRLYDIDVALRDVFLMGLELAEVSVKASIADVFGHAYDAFGYLDPSHFAATFTRATRSDGSSPYCQWLDKLRAEVRRSHEPFITHFKRTYLEYPDLPIWMICEIASFGSISRLFESMLRTDQRAIANRYGLQPGYLDSWLHAFVYQRNVCAHHARLWDKSLSITPRLPPAKVWDSVRAASNNSLYPAAMTLNWMLCHSSAPSSAVNAWRKALVAAVRDLQNTFPSLVSHTGFPPNWDALDIWS